MSTQNYVMAEKMYLEAINKKFLPAISKLAHMYGYKLDNPIKAKQYYLKAIEAGECYDNLNYANYCNYKLKDYDTAYKYYLKFMEDYRKYHKEGKTPWWYSDDLVQLKVTDTSLHIAKMLHYKMKNTQLAKNFFNYGIKRNYPDSLLEYAKTLSDSKESQYYYNKAIYLVAQDKQRQLEEEKQKRVAEQFTVIA